MTATETMMPPSAVRPVTWRSDAVLGLAGALLALCLHAAAGFPTLIAGHDDNDSLLRLVEIRDLMAGQGWFDLHQYRMGLPGGFVMHWSRLVDAPIAALILAGTAVTGSSAAGETFALLVWPTLLMAAALTFIARIARAVGGSFALLPALTIGGAALHFGGNFAPGDIDHHNIQLTLTLTAMAALIIGRGYISGISAGTACALMLAVGMETLPYVAVTGLTVSGVYLLGGRAEAIKATGFGLGFAAAAATAFVMTVPFGEWFAAQCDAYSIPQFSIALVCGLGLAAVATALPHGRSMARPGALLALATLIAVLVVTPFPQCLAGPYAGLDPRLQQYWLNEVSEAQPFWSVISNDWVKGVRYYVTPVLGLMVLRYRLRRHNTPEQWMLAVFLAAACAVSLWQVRGATFALPIAAIALAAWVGDWRQRAASASDRSTMLRLALVWLVSLDIVWGAVANAASVAMTKAASEPAASAQGTCNRTTDYAALAAGSPTTVLAISNLGAPILAFTRHRVLAGPYHRNIAGNLFALDAFMGTSEQARAMIRDSRIGMIAICRGNGETALLAGWAPTGFLAAFINGHEPDWLEKLPQAAGQPLEIYRVRP
ncbi:MAG: GtrA family protein [Bradyrhizobium sp.]|nr:GtrA family protein [Bradyrhizobium sp.]